MEAITVIRDVEKEYKEAAREKVETEANLREKEAELAEAKEQMAGEPPAEAEPETTDTESVNEGYYRTPEDVINMPNYEQIDPSGPDYTIKDANGNSVRYVDHDGNGKYDYDVTTENTDGSSKTVYYDEDGNLTFETTRTSNDNGDKTYHYIDYDKDGNIIYEETAAVKPDGTHYYEENGMVEENS